MTISSGYEFSPFSSVFHMFHNPWYECFVFLLGILLIEYAICCISKSNTPKAMSHIIDTICRIKNIWYICPTANWKIYMTRQLSYLMSLIYHIHSISPSVTIHRQSRIIKSPRISYILWIIDVKRVEDVLWIQDSWWKWCIFWARIFRYKSCILFFF